MGICLGFTQRIYFEAALLPSMGSGCAAFGKIPWHLFRSVMRSIASLSLFCSGDFARA